MTVKPADVLAFLKGLLIGAFFVALIASGFGANAATFLLIVLALYFIVVMVTGVNVLLLIGVLVGAVLIILIPAISPAALMDAGLPALALIVLIVR